MLKWLSELRKGTFTTDCFTVQRTTVCLLTCHSCTKWCFVSVCKAQRSISVQCRFQRTNSSAIQIIITNYSYTAWILPTWSPSDELYWPNCPVRDSTAAHFHILQDNCTLFYHLLLSRAERFTRQGLSSLFCSVRHTVVSLEIQAVQQGQKAQWTEAQIQWELRVSERLQLFPASSKAGLRPWRALIAHM